MSMKNFNVLHGSGCDFRIFNMDFLLSGEGAFSEGIGMNLSKDERLAKRSALRAGINRNRGNKKKNPLNINYVYNVVINVEESNYWNADLLFSELNKEVQNKIVQIEENFKEEEDTVVVVSDLKGKPKEIKFRMLNPNKIPEDTIQGKITKMKEKVIEKTYDIFLNSEQRNINKTKKRRKELFNKLMKSQENIYNKYKNKLGEWEIFYLLRDINIDLVKLQGSKFVATNTDILYINEVPHMFKGHEEVDYNPINLNKCLDDKDWISLLK